MKSQFVMLQLGTLLTSLLLVLRTGNGAEDEIQRLPKEVVKAWEQANAKSGWLCVNRIGFFIFDADREKIEKISSELDPAIGFTRLVPSFKLDKWKEGDFASLTSPACPFGLSVVGPLTEKELEAIAAMEHLEVLDLKGTFDGGGKVIDPMTRDQLKIVARMKNLKALSLESCFEQIGIPTDALTELGPLQKLVYLNLGRNNIRDSDLKSLSELKNLQGLNLRFTWVKGRGLKDLAGLEQLKWLSIVASAPKNPCALEDMKGVATLKNLQVLELFDLGIDDGGIVELAKLPKLRYLKCNGLHYPHKMSDSGLQEIAKMTSLTRLIIRNHRVTNDGIKSLQRALPKCVLDIELPR